MWSAGLSEHPNYRELSTRLSMASASAEAASIWRSVAACHEVTSGSNPPLACSAKHVARCAVAYSFSTPLLPSAIAASTRRALPRISLRAWLRRATGVPTQVAPAVPRTSRRPAWFCPCAFPSRKAKSFRPEEESYTATSGAALVLEYNPFTHLLEYNPCTHLLGGANRPFSWLARQADSFVNYRGARRIALA